jgi:hypothetical protein
MSFSPASRRRGMARSPRSRKPFSLLLTARPDVSTSSLSVTPEDVSGILNDHTKHMTNQLHYMLEDGLVKIFKTLSTSSGP